MSCPRKDENRCWDRVENDYFFYLSFENSLCKDYITETFFNAFRRKIVPLVLGGALDGNESDYINGLGAPPHSFIDIRQYSSPKLLAEYLNTLYANPELYAEYFWWKEHYDVSFNPVQVTANTYCDLCNQKKKLTTKKLSKILLMEANYNHFNKCAFGYEALNALAEDGYIPEEF